MLEQEVLDQEIKNEQILKNTQREQRLKSGILIIALLCFVICYAHTIIGAIVVAASITLIAVLGISEFYAMQKKKGMEPMVGFGIGITIAYMFLVASIKIIPAYFNEESSKNFKFFLQFLLNVNISSFCVLLIIITAIILVFSNRTENAIARFASTLCGFFYITFLLSCVLYIIMFDYNPTEITYS